MRSISVGHPVCLIAFIGVAFIFVGGCNTQTRPPGPDAFGTSVPGMNIAYLQWKEGLRVLFVDDVKDRIQTGGSQAQDNPVYTSIVSAGAPESGGYKCQLETKDGKSAKCSINGKDYDLSKGTLFVVKSKGEQVEVHQLQRDLTKIPFDAEPCRDMIQKDAEIRKLLGLGELPK